MKRIIRATIPEAIGGLLVVAVTASIAWIYRQAEVSILIVMAVLSIIVGCTYVALSRTDPLILGGRGAWRFPRARQWSVITIVVISVVALGGAVERLKSTRKSMGRTVVLVTDFDGPDPMKYRVTETLLARLRPALDAYQDVEVHAIERRVSEIDGSPVARELGADEDATVVIWGWYGVTDNAVEMSVHFELLQLTEVFPDLGSEVRGEPSLGSINSINSFALQQQLSREMTYLSHFTVGLSRYVLGDWGHAIEPFRRALDAHGDEASGLDPSIVHFYLGRTYQQIDDDKQALNEYSQSIALNLDGALPAYVNRGWMRALSEDYSNAVSDFTKAIEIAPCSALPYRNRGFAYRELGNNRAALEDLSTAIGLAQDQDLRAASHHDRGLTYRQLLEHRLAIADFNQVLALSTERELLTLARVGRALSLADLGDFDEAFSDLRLAASQSPGSAVTYNARGLIRMMQSDYDGAVTDFNKAIELDRNDGSYYANRGRAHDSRGELDLSLRDFDTAIALRPDDATLHHDRGVVLANHERCDEAILEFSKAIALGVSDGGFYEDRGQAYYFCKRNAQLALVDLDKAIDLAPLSGKAYCYRGSVRLELGNYDAALQDFDTLLCLLVDPEIRLCGLLGRGKTHGAREEYDEAISDLTSALALKPNDAEAHFLRGKALAGAFRFPEALDDLAEAARPNVHDDIRYLAIRERGLIHSVLRNSELAISDLNMSLERTPDDARALNGRGFAYSNIGDSTQALLDYGRAIELEPMSVSALLNRGKLLVESGNKWAGYRDLNQVLSLTEDPALRAIAGDLLGDSNSSEDSPK